MSKLNTFSPSKLSLLLISTLILLHISGVLSTDANKGPKADHGNLRSRFPINFQKSVDSSSGKKSSPGNVKIIEALTSRKRNVLKSNPSPHSSRNGGVIKSVENSYEDLESSDQGGDNDSGESEELLELQENGLSNSQGSYGPSAAPSPVYHPSSSNVAGGWGKPRPTMISYKPIGSSPQPPIIFPPITSQPQPQPTPTEPGPTDGPTSPSGTIVPIIGVGQGQGGGVGGIGGVEAGDDEDLFPPSQSQPQQSVGRSLNLKSSSPRTRVLSVAAVTPRGSTRVGPVASSTRMRTRLRDKVRESLEDTGDAEQAEPSLGPDVITDFVFSDIRCFKTRSKEYFGATIHMKSGYHTPYVRDRPQDPLTSNDCRMEPVPGSKDVFHMTVTDLKGCGVENCDDFMCLTMVFPRVPTLALADDEVTTIKCLPQKSTMADTRTISFAGDSLDNRRSSSTVEGGGQEFAAEVGVFRQNPGAASGLFVKRVNSGGVVQLGEPLQLRSIVRGGDGWKHSRLSDVKVWRMRDVVPSANLDKLDPNDASEVITLVDGIGCRNLEYVVIADNHPLKDPRNELVNHFTFKAFLFRGQRANEPLILTAKVHACQEDIDCVPKDCEESSRKKRSAVEIRNASAIIHDWDSRMALRVVGLKDHSASLTEEDFPSDYSGSQGRGFSDTAMTCAQKMAISGLGGTFIALLLTGLCLALYAYVKKGRSKGNSDFPVSFIENNNNHQSTRRHPGPNPNQNQGGFINPGTVRGTMGNKPLPPPPLQQQPENDKLSSSEISNVAKILKKLADTKPHESKGPQQDPMTDYECIDETETSSTSSSTSSGKPPGGKGSKKSDGVYIVYCCNDKKNQGKRPKSAPPSLREKRGSKKGRKKVVDRVYTEPVDSISDSQTEATAEDSEADSSDAVGKNVGSKCSAFADRRTVRNVKSRSNHHNNTSGGGSYNSKHNRVITGIRRRLSSFRKDGRAQQARDNGSFLSWQKQTGSGKNRSLTTSSRGQNRRRAELSDGLYSSSTPQTSSDLDSAYYGSEFNDDVLLEMRHLATQHSKRSYPQGSYQQGQVGNNNNNTSLNASNVKKQLQNGKGLGNFQIGLPLGPSSPRLEPGQTKAAHFVTRNESSTQILIVPETHV